MGLYGRMQRVGTGLLEAGVKLMLGQAARSDGAAADERRFLFHSLGAVLLFLSCRSLGEAANNPLPLPRRSTRGAPS
jgi:hypothetical protein